jgi:hypothetical protein
MKLAVFGEILWDVFEKETRIGGAPFNFAAHSAKLGADVTLISAVGNDALGDQAIVQAQNAGIHTHAIARTAYPTGRCQVTLENGAPSYALIEDVAYDHIPVPESALCQGDAFYFGTLAQRGAVSAAALRELLKNNYRERFFDINIRQNYYSPESIDLSLRAATIFKVSREELGVCNLPGTPEEICRETAKKYPNLKLILVTLDKDGAFAFDCACGKSCFAPQPKAKAISTVGAGDSFSAGFLVNYLSGKSMEECLSRATALSDFVVTQLGAVPEYPPELYKRIVPHV